MEIKRDDHSVNILMNAYCENDMGSVGYVEFDKKTLKKYLDLRIILETLWETQRILYLPLEEDIYWLDIIPKELKEVVASLEDELHLSITKIPDSLLDSSECSTEYGEVHIKEHGILFKAFFRHTCSEISSEYISWECIEEYLKRCDPLSVRFIRDEAPEEDSDESK